jgi:hypothetical protein
MSGVREVMGRSPLDVACEVVFDKSDEYRRQRAQRRVELLRDNGENVLRAELVKIFRNPARRERVEAFASLAQSSSFFRRVVREVAGVVASKPPQRTVSPDVDQVAYNALLTESRFNARVKRALIYRAACNSAALLHRMTKRLGLVVDALPPSQFACIRDPDDSERVIAFIYAVPSQTGGRQAVTWVYWDADEAFAFNERGVIVPIPDPSGQLVARLTPANGHPGIMPVVIYGDPSDHTTGTDLEAAHTSAGYLRALTLRVHKTQGHTQLGITGDPGTFPRGQVPDDENPIFYGTDNSGAVLANPTDPGHHLKTEEHVRGTTGADYGLNRDRLNQSGPGVQEIDGLLERRADLIEEGGDAEREAFAIIKVVSRSHHDETRRLSEEATLEGVDYPELSARVDRDKQLAIRREERSLGLRSVIDDVLEDNPELGGDREKAKEEVIRNLEEESWYILERRALNIADGASAEEPGQDPADNGAMGPQVRDGKLSKDDAAELARKGKPPATEEGE